MKKLLLSLVPLALSLIAFIILWQTFANPHQEYYENENTYPFGEGNAPAGTRDSIMTQLEYFEQGYLDREVENLEEYCNRLISKENILILGTMPQEIYSGYEAASELIRSLGAEIRLVSKEEGGFLGSIEMAKNLSDCRDCVYLPSQFSNEDNVETHFLTTGPELWWQLRFRSLIPDAFVAGLGTGGIIMGLGRYLKEQNPGTRIYPLEPENSPTLSTGSKMGKHRIQGISDDFIPSIMDLESKQDPNNHQHNFSTSI